jgi:hypothetical protein
VASRLRIVDRVEQCAWCQRTILTGELLERYVTDDRDTVPVCMLCAPAADDHGWVREYDAARGGLDRSEPSGRREGGWMRLFGRRGARDVDDDDLFEEAWAQPPPLRVERRTAPLEHPDDTGRLWTAPPAAERPPAPSTAETLDPAAPPPAAAPADPAGHDKLSAAVLLFNESAYPRTISGIAKALGAPSVSVVAVGAQRPEVVITVAWELSWYQFLVDEEQLRQPVRQLRRGEELEELAEEWRRQNATARSDGTILLAGAPGAGGAEPDA